ncbi:hypothetical protein [Nesterenkonia rhizosphaerae]|uniref:RNA polymerase sigma-70 region 2 domain-containing protein n=1 Tax=Nesterenkonia rhizosphaerae TaxID=1348272 RepID=A0ABP9G014_9MICC
MASEETTEGPLAGLEALARSQDEELIERFLIENRREIQYAARTAARFYGRHHNHELLQDVESLAIQEAWAICRDVVAGTLRPSTIRSFRNYISVRIRTPLRTLIEQTEVMASGAYSSKYRRATALERLRDEMTVTLGRIPRDVEVVAEHNRRAAETSKDPHRQGRWATVEDVGFHRPAQPIMAETPDAEDSAELRSPAGHAHVLIHHDDDPGALLTSWEGEGFRSRVATACAAKDQRLGAVASAWLEAASASEHQQKSTIKAMMQAAGCTREELEGLISEIRVTSIHVLAEMTDLSVEQLLGTAEGL